MDRLEQSSADSQAAYRRLESRLEELQIAFSLLRSQVEGTAPRTPAAATAAGPDLKVVRLRPAPPPEPRPRPAPPAPRSLPPVDPDQVAERLPVDRAAAARPLMDEAAEPVAPAQPDQQAATEFDSAFGLYRTNDFEKAAPALEAFAEHYSGHAFAPEALFFAAKARMILGRVDEAEAGFLALAKRHPASERAAEALLQAARCQERLGRDGAARETYNRLVTAYPTAEQATEASRRLEKFR